MRLRPSSRQTQRSTQATAAELSLNSKGEVIGINEAKYADTSVEGVGYAIPISKAKDIIDDLMTRTTKIAVSESEQGYLGIQLQNIDESMAKMYGMPQGVYVYKIMEDSAPQVPIFTRRTSLQSWMVRRSPTTQTLQSF